MSSDLMRSLSSVSRTSSRRRFLGQLASVSLGGTLTGILPVNHSVAASHPMPDEPERKITTGILTPDLRDRRPEKTLSGHQDVVRSAVFSRDGERILTASMDQTVILWDARTARPIRVFRRESSDPLVEAIFSPDEQRIIAYSMDCTTTVWDLNGGKQREFRGRRGRSGTPRAFNPVNPREVTTLGRNYSVYVVDTADGTYTARCVGHRAPVTTVAFRQDASALLTGSLDQTLIVWDFPSEELRNSQKTTPMVLPRRNTIYTHSPVLSAVFGPDGETVLSGLEDHTVVLWELRYGEKLRTFHVPHQRIHDVAMSADGSILAAAGTIVAIWPDAV
ncbi:MAG: WD40 repeat domain-containing protein [Planctomycetia bacterium]|nr:WD40 repeat domain-containing protein [Planctomycetia bacterium]